MISRIRSVCSTALLGVKARWTSALSRSCLGGSCEIIMFSAMSIGSGAPGSDARWSTRMMLRFEENVSWSLPTAAMSS